MERESHAMAAAAAAAYRRWEAPAEDVIVVSSGRPPRHLQQQQQQPSEGMVVAGLGQPYAEPPEKVYYKTKLCDKYEASGRCVYEDGCTFAHGHAELRPPLPTHGGGGGGCGGGSWRRPAPAQEHAKGGGGFHGGGGGGVGFGKVCFLFRDKGSCHYGDKCAFPHASAPGSEMRNPAGEPKQVEARRSATPSARSAFPPAPAAPRYAPVPARAFPPVPAASAVRGRLSQVPEEDGGKAASTLTLLSRRKTSGIYGDWPEEY